MRAWYAQDYLAILSPQNRSSWGAHGGGLAGGSDGGQCYYHQSMGKFHRGLVGVAIELTTPNLAMGFGCVPGSHKAAFDLPSEWASA